MKKHDNLKLWDNINAKRVKIQLQNMININQSIKMIFNKYRSH